MFVANMLQEQPYHLIRACNFATGAVDRIAHLLLDPSTPSLGSSTICIGHLNAMIQRRTLILEAGIHCGSVVLNVIGKDNPRFCVLGDT